MVLLTTLNSKYIHTALALYSLQTYCRRDFPAVQVKEFNINQDLEVILGAIYQTHPPSWDYPPTSGISPLRWNWWNE